MSIGTGPPFLSQLTAPPVGTFQVPALGALRLCAEDELVGAAEQLAGGALQRARPLGAAQLGHRRGVRVPRPGRQQGVRAAVAGEPPDPGPAAAPPAAAGRHLAGEAALLRPQERLRRHALLHGRHQGSEEGRGRRLEAAAERAPRRRRRL